MLPFHADSNATPRSTTPSSRLLRQVGRRVALVRLDDLSGDTQLLVSVAGVDDLLLRVVDDSEGREAVRGTELVAPAGRDGVSAADVAAGVGLSSWLARDLKCARGGDGVGFDAEVPGADTVEAGALHVGDGPLRGCGHLGDGARRWCWCCESGDREGGGGEDGGELHVDGCFGCGVAKADGSMVAEMLDDAEAD